MDMNGHAQAMQQMQAMQQFEGFVKNALTQAQSALTQAQSALGPEFKAAAIFTHATDRSRDLLIVPVGLAPATLIAAIQARMQAAGVPMPANDAATAPKSEGPTPDLHLAVINVVSAIRRAMPFITGPGAETARKMLLDAIKADGVSETARQVVAGFLSAVPGMTDQHPGEVDKLLAQAIDGAGEATLVFYSNPELGRHQ